MVLRMVDTSQIQGCRLALALLRVGSFCFPVVCVALCVKMYLSLESWYGEWRAQHGAFSCPLWAASDEKYTPVKKQMLQNRSFWLVSHRQDNHAMTTHPRTTARFSPKIRVFTSTLRANWSAPHSNCRW